MSIFSLLKLAASTGFFAAIILGTGWWMGAVFMAILRGRARRCPRCNSNRTRWSMVRVVERFLPAFALPRRCESCQFRFYAAHSVNYVRRDRARAAAMAAPKPARTLVPAQGDLA